MPLVSISNSILRFPVNTSSKITAQTMRDSTIWLVGHGRLFVLNGLQRGAVFIFALDARFHGAIQLPVDSTRPSSNHVDEDINANYTDRELGLPTKEHREMVRVFDSENTAGMKDANH